ncbi:MAG: aminotransferase class III-fold pyridoxal phosphate-dependent enzyme, partial [Planctomycetales bacterium]
MLKAITKEAPALQTELPGPNAQRIIASDDRVSSTSYTRFYPLVVRRGEGAVLEDVDGNLFLDFTAGIAVCNTGHCHPQVVEAVQRQAAELMHMCGADFYYEPWERLANTLARIAPGDSPKRVFFTNSGAETVEAAIKLARYHTGRHRLIAFHGAFHGRTLGALSLTGSKATQRRRFGPLLSGVTHIPYSMAGLDELENTVFPRTAPPEDVAAVVVEPIQGEGGYVVPHPEFHSRLQAITR